jgi:hypothetical protein
MISRRLEPEAPGADSELLGQVCPASAERGGPGCGEPSRKTWSQYRQEPPSATPCGQRWMSRGLTLVVS